MGRLVLVGLPGTGKTTVARSLGALWGWEALDTDDLVALDVGVAAPEYLRAQGEDELSRARVAGAGSDDRPGP